MEGDTENSTFQDPKDTEMEIMETQKSLKKKRKSCQKNKFIDTQCKIYSLIKNISHQKIEIAR